MKVPDATRRVNLAYSCNTNLDAEEQAELQDKSNNIAADVSNLIRIHILRRKPRRNTKRGRKSA